MSTDRDTHFAGFAALLYKEIRNDLSNVLVPGITPQQEQRMKQRIQQLIVPRAYDLVFRHALVYLREGADIPDLTEWPVERDEE